MKEFNLLASNIINLELKLAGKLPVNREELFSLVTSWGRNDWFFTLDENNNEMFFGIYKSNEKYDLSNLDVSEITNFDSIFKFSNFNGDISKWEVSNATSMNAMFCEAKEFNSPLDKWDTSNVISMDLMFAYTEEFNQNINSWDIAKVTSMYRMFLNTKEFNQPLDKWDTSNVTLMEHMFYGTKKFNQNLNSWNISKVKDMGYMFKGAEAFNQAILWDLSNNRSCYAMFLEAKAFEDRFNKGKKLPDYSDKIKEWLIDNRDRMIALDIKENKSKELDNFLENFDVIDSANLNGLHNNMEIDNGNL